MEPVLTLRWTSHGYDNLKQCHSPSNSQGICARKYSNCCGNKWVKITFSVQTKRSIHLSATKPPSLPWIVVNYQLSETQKKFGDRVLTDNYDVVTGNLSPFLVYSGNRISRGVRRQLSNMRACQKRFNDTLPLETEPVTRDNNTILTPNFPRLTQLKIAVTNTI